MRISRREFLKYCTIAAGALGLTTTDLLKIEECFAKVGDGGPHVVWLPGQACTGCTVSLANSVYYATVDDVLLNKIDLDYSETLMAASGEKAVEAAISVIGKTSVLALEGAIPHGNNGEEEFCTVWSRPSGIVAAGSVINTATLANGTLTKDVAGAATLTTGDVIKLGSEIVNPTTIPGGSTVASAADRAALGGTYVGTATSGSDILNTNVTVGPLAVSGQIFIWGGTSLPVNTLGTGTILAGTTIVESSFDRFWLSNLDPSQPAAATPAAIFGPDANGNPWVLTNSITLNVPRSVAGPFVVANLSTLGALSFLRAGSRVTGLATRLLIDPTLAKFGYGSSDANVLAAAITYTGADYVLTGDVTLPTAGIAVGSLGFTTTEVDKTMLNEARLLGTSAAAILCIGTCSSFGGIPAATGNVTGAAGALYTGLKKPGQFNGALTEFAAKTINVPGCPPHSDWIVGTIAYLLARNLQAFPPMEAYSRPLDFYGMYQCNAGPCEWRYNQGYNALDETNYVNPKTAPYAANHVMQSSQLYRKKWANSGSTRFVGCLGAVGCKGRKTKADCSLRRWNANAALQYGAGWCVGSGAGCHGCTEPTFPDKVGKFFNFA